MKIEIEYWNSQWESGVTEGGMNYSHQVSRLQEVQIWGRYSGTKMGLL